jgi:hypothetical protein
LCARTEPVYQPDGIHLQIAGRKIVARRLDQLLQEQHLAGDSSNNFLAERKPRQGGSSLK